MDEGMGILLKTMRGQRSRSLLIWVAIAASFVLLGTLGSVFGANGVANATDQQNDRAFLTSSNAIASTLHLAIQHEQDLIDSTKSFLMGNPNATRSQFTQWSNSLHVLRHYPDLSGLGVIVYVPAAQLSAYVKNASLLLGKPFVVTPPGARPFYCFSPLGIARPGTPRLPREVDLCDGSASSYITSPRTSGQSLVLPYRSSGQETIALETPIYRGGVIPSTPAARERNFVAIIGLNLVPNVILQTARKGHPGTAVALSFTAAGSKLVFESGVVPKSAQSNSINLIDGWTVKTYTAEGPGGLFANGSASLIFYFGMALSLLLGAVMFLLGTGRARSLLLVGERTEQLRYQALHDSLTGLPNRAFIVERMSQLLERNRQRGTLGAALFVDLDDFKNVNDSLGHEAGDQLLVSVAQRMKSTLRGADTIGRMGGDEFVILIDGAPARSVPTASLNVCSTSCASLSTSMARPHRSRSTPALA
jgi:diguanylate cyclase (GGDEF)-like protein